MKIKIKVLTLTLAFLMVFATVLTACGENPFEETTNAAEITTEQASESEFASESEAVSTD